MMDVLLTGLALGFLALSWGPVELCERLAWILESR
jgi:hypothetical protein